MTTRATQTKIRLCNYLFANFSTFTDEENQRLLELYEEHGSDWTTIGLIMGRTTTACYAGYRHISENYSENNTLVYSTLLLLLLKTLCLKENNTLAGYVVKS